ncbi:nuclear transport factor 2 family protein [Polaribacter porphyrae]|uniref:Uncharacterized protein n=1 Tax=Polaribacter porphyrae TaxID=1137780 RepID=A0A2S7WK75_9FLAO|nr:nuclear transport factor 2 family protein [Polaribacter porphyrae]PQJ77692.1 hypothetical protein BTO18_00170 [Polaribacter porphyrae]
MKILKLPFILLCLSLAILSSCISNEPNDKKLATKFNQEDYKLVNAAILDYVDGLYLVDSTRIDKSVDKKLRKVGFWYNPDKKEYVDNLEMTHTQLSNLAAKWNKSGKRVNKDSPKEIEIFDVNSKTASAKLTAAWGIDLFHLAKVDNQWKIVNVIWQSQPKTE